MSTELPLLYRPNRVPKGPKLVLNGLNNVLRRRKRVKKRLKCVPCRLKVEPELSQVADYMRVFKQALEVVVRILVL